MKFELWGVLRVLNQRKVRKIDFDHFLTNLRKNRDFFLKFLKSYQICFKLGVLVVQGELSIQTKFGVIWTFGVQDTSKRVCEGLVKNTIFCVFLDLKISKFDQTW